MSGFDKFPLTGWPYKIWTLEDFIRNDGYVNTLYVGVPTLNAIKEHPEIYKKKAIFWGLVSEAFIHGGYAVPVSDEARLFVREQLTKNGTIEAAKNGKLHDFLVENAKKDLGENARTFIIYKTNIDVESFYDILNTAKTSKEIYDEAIKNDSFSYNQFKCFLDEKDKAKEAFKCYRRTLHKFLRNGVNPFTTSWFQYTGQSYVDSFPISTFLPNVEAFLRTVFREFKYTDIALELIRDMATYTIPTYGYDWFTYERKVAKKDSSKRKIQEYRPQVFGSLELQLSLFEKEIRELGIEKEVQQILKEYNERPDVIFWKNANTLQKKRKVRLIKKDFENGTNLVEEKMRIPKVFEALEAVVSKKIYGNEDGRLNAKAKITR